ncbi:unnamed protein product [Brassica oleracea]|uniref:Uncharacterized protein n=1 Tax=Brassica oleracea TaxID=3712 RepID=A0A3P6EML2_BRAOL|nr:unnamed protein product [Brassica oleracea]
MWILVASSIPWRRSLHHLCDPVPCWSALSRHCVPDCQ